MNVFCILSNDRSVEVFRFSTVEDVKKKLQRRRKRQKSKAEESEMMEDVEETTVSVEPNDLVKSVRFFRLESRARSFCFRKHFTFSWYFQTCIRLCHKFH